MTQFRGFSCDDCKAVIKDGERTRYTEKFDGPVLQGEVVKDLCPVCTEKRAPASDAVRPLRRRKTAKGRERHEDAIAV